MADIRQYSVPPQKLGIDNEENSLLKKERTRIHQPPWQNTKKGVINVTADMIADVCRDGVVEIGETKLGILRSEIATRSLRSGAAMAMHLDEVPVFSIMLVGRWSSTSGG